MSSSKSVRTSRLSMGDRNSNLPSIHLLDRVRAQSRSALDRQLAATLFPNIQCFDKKDIRISLRSFVELVVDTVAKNKKLLPGLKLARFGNKRTVRWCLRSDANILSIDGVEGDYDRGEMSLEEAAEHLRRAQLAALLYETASSTLAKPRFRIFCPCSQSLPPALRSRYVARLNGVLGGTLDGASFTLSQFFYFGGLVGNEAPRYLLIEGEYIDLRADLDEFALGKGIPNTVSKLVGDVESREIDRSKKARGIALEIRWNGGEKADFLRELRKDPVLSQWQTEKGQREVDRAWQYGKDQADEQSKYLDNAFEDLSASRTTLSPLERMNRSHAVVRNGGDTLIATFGREGTVNFGSVADLHLFYKNKQIAINGKKKSVSEHWIEWTKRRQYDHGVTFDPSNKTIGRTLNLWSGWAVRANADASCNLLREHLLNVVCGNDQRAHEYLMGWLAHLVQHPGVKPGVGVVLRGDKGAGKDIVADYLTRLIGRRFVSKISDANHLTGRFNAHMETALLLHVEEGSWAGDRNAERNLKSLVTSETIQIERKGIDPISLPSVMRIFISSNADWVVPASYDERRWAVFNVRASRCGDREYFNALAAEMNGEGPAALLDYLQSYDLTGFDVRTAPQTEGLLEQKLESLRDFDLFWFNALYRGHLPGSSDWETTVECAELRKSYNLEVKDNRYKMEPKDERFIGKQLKKLCRHVKHGKGPRPDRAPLYEFPNLQNCRRAFEKVVKYSIKWES